MEVEQPSKIVAIPQNRAGSRSKQVRVEHKQVMGSCTASPARPSPGMPGSCRSGTRVPRRCWPCTRVGEEAARTRDNRPVVVAAGVRLAGAASRMVCMSGGYALISIPINLIEAVLRCQAGNAEVMVGQLGHLLSVISMPWVPGGVIPFNVRERPMWVVEGFVMFDDARADAELLSASAMAVHGHEARALITSAIAALG